jgi:nucleotide-binding universal stress UspA family protein
MSERPTQPLPGSVPGPAPARPIVVGYDADNSGTDALVLGLRLGAMLGRPVTVAKVHADPAPIGAGRVDAEWVADRRAASAAVLETAQRQVEKLALTDPPPIDYRLVPSSSAAHGLSDLAERQNAGMIVVGSAAGEGFERRVFAGSTASRLLSGAHCPVAIAPKGLAEHHWPAAPRIAVGYLATDEGELALRAATEAARRSGGSLHLFTAVAPEASVVPWLIGVDGEKAFAATAREGYQAALDQAAARLLTDEPGPATPIPVSTSLLIGDVVDLLADLPDVDLLFCGSRGYGPVRRVLLGGVSSRLVRRCTRPLVVVPRPS